MAGKSTVLFPAFCGRGVKVEKNRTNDMTTGNPIKLIIMFMIPMFLGNIFQQFYNIVDSIVTETVSCHAVTSDTQKNQFRPSARILKNTFI